jgi:hypothetical protein
MGRRAFLARRFRHGHHPVCRSTGDGHRRYPLARQVSQNVMPEDPPTYVAGTSDETLRFESYADNGGIQRAAFRGSIGFQPFCAVRCHTRVSGITCFSLSPSKGQLMAGARIWRISSGGPPGRSGCVPLRVPEGLLVPAQTSSTGGGSHVTEGE